LGYQQYLKCHLLPRDLNEDEHRSCAKTFCIFIIILNSKPRDSVANLSFEFLTVRPCFRNVSGPKFPVRRPASLNSFLDFPNSSKQFPKQCLKLDNDRLLTDPF
jgi:hypothetical protein